MANARQQDRLDVHPANLIDRSTSVEFEFDGRRIQAHEGDTIASALYAAGVRIFSRSFKYHRPRGLLCVSGACPNCLMTVDGVPNVRTCSGPVRPGMKVRHQNAWPSLEHDSLAILDRFDRLMPVGFFYKTFHRPKVLWQVAEPIIRRVAGLGSIDIESVPTSRYRHEFKHTDVAVVGGGAAGMAAALSAEGAGARVVLIDDQPSLGGSLRFDARSYDDVPGTRESSGLRIGTELAGSVHSADGIEVLSSATAFGLYEDNLLGVLAETSAIKLRARSVIVATGSYESPLIFDRNDLPGVMLGSAMQRLMRLYGIKPGSTVMVATSGDEGYYTALDLLEAGVRIAVLVDTRPGFPRGLDAAASLQSRGVLVLASHAMLRAEGTKRVVGGAVARLEDGRPTTEERQFDCDLISMSGGLQPADSLLRQAGCVFGYDESLDRMVPREMAPSVFAAGEVAGAVDPRMSVLQGRMAGLEAALVLGRGPRTDLDGLRGELEAAASSYRDSARPAPALVVPEGGVKKFVCFCEDVTAKDIADGIEEGFDDVQTLKRYSTVTMGPCQGKMCLKAFAGICASLTGRTIDETGVTTSRPPVQPVPLSALAGPSHLPIKRTSIDRKHRSSGAQMVDTNQWQRPYSYSSPQEECVVVRERVGIIDVSTLGKLDVSGHDAGALLDKVYTHHFSNLRVGRIRYGVLCADNGVIMDDGTVTRLADDRFLVTTSTASVESIEEWFKWWLAGTGMCAHVTNITASLAAINVAGPRARDTLSKLTDVDLSPKAFRYMRSAQGDVAGVPTIFLRIGFVGETGWELHFPSEYGEYMWDVLLEAGKEFGIAQFGTEAQRILRLEKKHFIPNQDTDMVTNPLDADAEWVVRFDKEDFIGRGGLAAARGRTSRFKLVGFVMRDGLVPDDGDPVVSGFAPVGRVTSSRLSPTFGKGFGLALVPPWLAQEGRLIHIRVDGRVVPANVTMKPLYDPEGKRLRE